MRVLPTPPQDLLWRLSGLGIEQMLYFRQSEDDARGVMPPDPCHYVRMADLALLYGSREEAEALVTLAYLAFDLMLAGCDEVTNWGSVWPGRSS